MFSLYLLDANVLIDANRDYYPIERVPEFWEWLLEMAWAGKVKIPQEMFEEVVHRTPMGQDGLVDWLRTHRDMLVLAEDVQEGLVANVTEQGYANDLSDDEIEKLGKDPFLIAYALADKAKRCVVTTERSRSSRARANRHLPDVCSDFNVYCCDTFALIRELDFSTNWRVNR